MINKYLLILMPESNRIIFNYFKPSRNVHVNSNNHRRNHVDLLHSQRHTRTNPQKQRPHVILNLLFLHGTRTALNIDDHINHQGLGSEYITTDADFNLPFSVTLVLTEQPDCNIIDHILRGNTARENPIKKHVEKGSGTAILTSTITTFGATLTTFARSDANSGGTWEFKDFLLYPSLSGAWLIG